MAYEGKVVAYLAFELIIAIISILGNSLVLIVFLRDRRLRTPTNLYVFSLATADFLTGAVATPIYVHSMLTRRPRDFHACLFVNTLILTFCTVSILHLVAVSYDRFMAVVWRRKPSTHRHGMLHTAILIGTAWALGLLIGCLPVAGWHGGAPPRSEAPKCEFKKVIRPRYLLFLFYATILTPTVLMVFFYGSIYYVIRRRRVRMLSVHYALDTRMDLQSTSPSTDDQEQAVSEQRQQEAGKRWVVFSLGLVVICFLVCWYPIHIMNIISYYCTDCVMEESWFYVPIVLSHVSNAANPFIYAGTMPGYKEAFADALSCRNTSTNLSAHRRRQSRMRKVEFAPEDSNDEMVDLSM